MSGCKNDDYELKGGGDECNAIALFVIHNSSHPLPLGQRDCGLSGIYQRGGVEWNVNNFF